MSFVIQVSRSIQDCIKDMETKIGGQQVAVTIEGEEIKCALSSTLNGMSNVDHSQPRRNQTRTKFTNAEIEWASFQKKIRIRIMEVLGLRYSNKRQDLADGVFIAKKTNHVAILRSFICGIMTSMLPCHGCGIYDVGTSGA